MLTTSKYANVLANNGTDFTVFIQHVYGSLWHWRHWSVQQKAFGRTLI